MTEVTPDQAYGNALKVFEKQVGEATQVWSASNAINEVSRLNKDICEALNLTPLFWITVRGALQEYTLIVIGCIFGQTRNSLKNIDTICRLTRESHETVFSADALRQVKNPSVSIVVEPANGGHGRRHRFARH